MSKPLSLEEKEKRKLEKESKEELSEIWVAKNRTREEALQEVKMYQSNDWDLVEETPFYFLIRRNTATFGGHILVLILTGWFTLGIGNVIYYFCSIQKKKIIK